MNAATVILIIFFIYFDPLKKFIKANLSLFPFWGKENRPNFHCPNLKYYTISLISKLGWHVDDAPA